MLRPPAGVLIQGTLVRLSIRITKAQLSRVPSFQALDEWPRRWHTSAAFRATLRRAPSGRFQRKKG